MLTASPVELQYPTEPYVPQASAHCTQPSVGLGEAIAMPLPLAPPQIPPPAVPKIKWKKTKEQTNGKDTDDPSDSGKTFFM